MRLIPALEDRHRSSVSPLRLLAMLFAAFWMASCSLRSPAASPSASPATLVPAEGSEPASGICAGPGSSSLALVEIYPDVPSPRCLQVLPEQGLLVVNRTEVEIVARLGPHEIRLLPGEEGSLPAPFGSYLAPGVHRVTAVPYSGPELVLAGSGGVD
jgi:hypothetical protein